ncbi:MAG: nucleotidyltransferase family protein [Alphaproteobacteria bacterium]
MTAITTAMVLAGGLGTRMRPITNTIPKPLVSVAGKTMLDRALDPLGEAGIETVVVNVHYLADQIEQAVSARSRPKVIISDEREALLDSGGGVRKALDHLGDVFIISNADSFWRDAGTSNIARLMATFDPAVMDTLLLLATLAGSVGFDGAGDFFLGADGRLERRGTRPSAPYVYAGAAVMTRSDFVSRQIGEVFSLNALWNASLARGRLHGLVLDGLWLHVGTPDAIGEAEAALAR